VSLGRVLIGELWWLPSRENKHTSPPVVIVNIEHISHIEYVQLDPNFGLSILPIRSKNFSSLILGFSGPGRMSHRLIVNSFKRVRRVTYLVNPLPDVQSEDAILSPHWRSEALIPTIDPETQKVTSFNRATSPAERSLNGAQFLKNPQALIHAANAVVRRSDNGVDGSRATAFQVGNGGLAPRALAARLMQVYLTHNHDPQRIPGGIAHVVLPDSKTGALLLY